MSISAKLKVTKIIFLTCVALSISSNSAWAQSFESTEPDLKTEEELMNIGAALVEMLNTSSEKTAIELAHKVFRPGSAEEWARSFRKEFGEVEPGKIRITAGDNFSTVHVIVRSKKIDDWRNFQLVFDNEAPRKSGRVNIVLAAPPMAIPEGGISDRNMISELEKYITQLAENERLSGSLIIADQDGILIQDSFGFANQDAKRKINSETPMGLASSSKMFTSVSILKLIQEGKMSLKDPLIKFLPDYPNKKFAKEATVAHFLSHTSGVGDYWDNEYEKHWQNISSLQEYLPFITNKPHAIKKPGEDGSYSNSNFILLGLIIESVTGESYFAHVQRTIFDPLGMTHTGYYKNGENKQVAKGYFDIDKNKAIQARSGLIGSSAGGAMSTPEDMLKFKTALINHELLNAEMLTLATSEQALLDGNTSYGYGFELNKRLSGFGHGGQGPGSGVTFVTSKQSGITFIFISNNLNGAYSELKFAIEEILAR